MKNGLAIAVVTISAVLSGVVGYSAGVAKASEIRRQNIELSEQIKLAKIEFDLQAKCESSLQTLSQEWEAGSLSGIKRMREGCSPERLAEFDAEFPEISKRIEILTLEAEKKKEEEARSKAVEAEKLREEQRIADLKRNSKWSTYSNTNAITDTEDIYLTLSSNRYSKRYDFESSRLTIRCKENTTSFILDFGEYVGNDSSSVYSDYKNVTLRIDDRSPVTRRMNVATNKEAVGFWSGDESIPFIKSLIGSERLVVRFTPYGENPREMTFETAGLEHFIDPVRKACSW